MSPSALCVYIEVLKSKHKFVTKPFTLLRRRNKGSYYVCMHACRGVHKLLIRYTALCCGLYITVS
jgi:hypothetical protein